MLRKRSLPPIYRCAREAAHKPNLNIFIRIAAWNTPAVSAETNVLGLTAYYLLHRSASTNSERVDALAPADQRRLPAPPRESGERGERRLHRGIAAARQRCGEDIHQRALGRMQSPRRQVVPPAAHDQSGQILGAR